MTVMVVKQRRREGRSPVGVSFVTTRVGSGDPVVLVHGIGHRRQAWDPIVPVLARHREVVAVDLPGFGESPGLPPDLPYDMPTTVQNFAKLFAELGLERPHVVGNSLGGAIALELGAAGLVRSVTALSPAGFWDPLARRWALTLLSTMRWASMAPPPLIAGLARSRRLRSLAMSPVFAHPERIGVESFVDDAALLRTSPAFGPTLAAGRDYDCFAVPDVPTLVAWGDHDRVLPPSQARRARERLPRARHVSLAGCGHVPMIDDPDLVTAVVLEGTTATGQRR
ncbi:alpha/beta fold hydrolase [Solicola sp. PLA-1-18]|uniref:alpha/beta fold hydrolase n=1 Tax=Solicola sp. PLA-1-18 TaxID=3380532 RepID=UPI003B792F0A